MKTVFLDRDGIINKDCKDYVKNWEEFSFLPGSKEAIAMLSKSGFNIFVVTNQSGIGRGVYSESDLHCIHEKMSKELEKSGGRIDKIYFCAHVPEDACKCRKPGTGMLKEASLEHGIDLKKSFMIGDKATDICAGKSAGCRTILVRTAISENYEGPQPDFCAGSLLEAVKIVLENVS
jgi:D-glycero-D-manno-heptose 1,7-bisphosphate phosphatase